MYSQLKMEGQSVVPSLTVFNLPWLLLVLCNHDDVSNVEDCSEKKIYHDPCIICSCIVGGKHQSTVGVDISHNC